MSTLLTQAAKTCSRWLIAGLCSHMFDSFLSVWSDGDWLKKFSSRTLGETKEEEGLEPSKVEAQEVKLKAMLLEERPAYSPSHPRALLMWVGDGGS